MFDVVSELESRKRKKRLRFVTFSVAAHGLVLGSIIAASLWEVGDITPPEVIRIVFPGAPHATDGGGGQHQGVPPSHVRPNPTATSHRLFVPPVIPTDIPGVAPLTDESTPSTGPESTPGPEEGAIPGPGPGNGPCLVNCGEQGSGAPLPVGGDVHAPVGIYQPQPAYPHSAIIGRQQGVVILQAIIGGDGAVENLGVMKGVSPLLDEAALKAVREWRYTPATLNGRAVRVYLTVTVNFTLR